jgi:hypothetical protein
VLGGSLANADRRFLDELYEHGIQGHYDGLAVHLYSGRRHPADPWEEEGRKFTFLAGLRWIHRGQRKAGDATAIWVTEFGWTTCDPPGERWCVTEEQQAEYLREAFEILGERSYVRAATAYDLRDNREDVHDLEANFGLVRRDYAPKAAYDAVRDELRGLKWTPNRP